MAEQTVCGALAHALEMTADRYHRIWCPHKTAFEDCTYPICATARLALDRHRAEPEGPCTVACDQPTEAHCVDHCPCYQAGANEGHSTGCNDDSCACWAAGHEAGLEARRERVG